MQAKQPLEMKTGLEEMKVASRQKVFLPDVFPRRQKISMHDSMQTLVGKSISHSQVS
jgi:hypothetical protein